MSNPVSAQHTGPAGSEGRTPNPVDLHVGLRLRARRRTLGLSQEALAEALGLTFQQVQKYERGANRVSASKLFECARALDVSPAFFFDGLDLTAGATVPEPSAIDRLPSTSCGHALAEAFVTLSATDQALVTGLAARLARTGQVAVVQSLVLRDAA